MIFWIASYPKSGNTWMRSFLSAYFMTDNGDFNIKKLDNIPTYPQQAFFNDEIIQEGEVYKFWEKSQKEIINKKKIKFLKTHNALISKNGLDFTYPKFVLGIIYIIRDPRNVITSVKNHYQIENYENTLEYMKNDRAIEFRKIDNSYSYYSFVTSWRMHYQTWNYTKGYKILTIKYEDMLRDPEKTFRDVVVFTNAVCHFNNRVDTKKLTKSIETTNFENLKKFEEDGSFKENIYLEDKRIRPKFFYLGKENKWEKLLTEEIKNKMNKYYKEDLIKLGYEKN